jgi:hypothetical protein
MPTVEEPLPYFTPDEYAEVWGDDWMYLFNATENRYEPKSIGIATYKGVPVGLVI